jgi:glutathione S-transferase
MGDKFTVADAYLFTVLRWCKLHKVDTTKWPVLNEYSARIAARTAVAAAMRSEGLS